MSRTAPPDVGKDVMHELKYKWLGGWMDGWMTGEVTQIDVWLDRLGDKTDGRSGEGKGAQGHGWMDGCMENTKSKRIASATG